MTYLLRSPDSAFDSDALRGLRYGQVTIIVQDERIVQIDRTEKQRLSAETRQP
ncbi:MAG: YezD family protein [Planctomycetaceae bacterium]